MRILVWIFGTLLSRSWLIIAGVLLGLLARQYFPPTASLGESQNTDPKAKAYYDRVVASNSIDSIGPDLTPSDLPPSDLPPSDLTPSDLTPSDLTPSDLTPSEIKSQK